MSAVRIEIPENSAFALSVPLDTVAETVRMAAAAKMYELGRLSSGAAAELAGVPRAVFLARLAEYGVVTFDLSPEEIEHDLKSA